MIYEPRISFLYCFYKEVVAVLRQSPRIAVFFDHLHLAGFQITV